jgi:hypothetical protein
VQAYQTKGQALHVAGKEHRTKAEATRERADLHPRGGMVTKSTGHKRACDGHCAPLGAQTPLKLRHALRTSTSEPGTARCYAVASNGRHMGQRLRFLCNSALVAVAVWAAVAEVSRRRGTW